MIWSELCLTGLPQVAGDGVAMNCYVSVTTASSRCCGRENQETKKQHAPKLFTREVYGTPYWRRLQPLSWVLPAQKESFPSEGSIATAGTLLREVLSKLLPNQNEDALEGSAAKTAAMPEQEYSWGKCLQNCYCTRVGILLREVLPRLLPCQGRDILEGSAAMLEQGHLWGGCVPLLIAHRSRASE